MEGMGSGGGECLGEDGRRGEKIGGEDGGDGQWRRWVVEEEMEGMGSGGGECLGGDGRRGEKIGGGDRGDG